VLSQDHQMAPPLSCTFNL